MELFTQLIVFIMLVSSETLVSASARDKRSACPQIVSRKEWRCRRYNYFYLIGAPGTHTVHIDQSGTRSCYSFQSCSAQIRDYENRSDIYNFMVGEDGRVYEGTGWNVAMAQVPAYFDDGFGICVIGNFKKRKPNGKALSAIRQLIRCAISRRKVDVTFKLRGIVSVATLKDNMEWF